MEQIHMKVKLPWSYGTAGAVLISLS